MSDVERLDPNRNYHAEDVARLVFAGLAVDRFYRRWRTLVRKEGFPPPISKYGRPVWNGARLKAWQERDQAPVPRPADSQRGELVDYSAVLRERLKSLKAGAGRHGRAS